MPNRNWTKEEYELLRTTGSVPGRSRRAIKRVQLRLGLRAKNTPRRPWTDELVAQLLALHEQGYTTQEIVNKQLLPCTRMAIQKKLCRLGLAKKCPANKLPLEWRERLKQFLMNSWQGKTPADLAELWNKMYPMRAVSEKRIVAYLQRLKIKIPAKEVLRINNQRKREKKIWEKHFGDTPEKVMERVRLSRAKFMQSRLERGRDLWTGMDLPEEELNEK